MTAFKSILIVEDEPLIAMMLEDFLESLGHQVVATCDSIEDALARVDEGGFDIAILDVQLRDGRAVWPIADRLAETGTPFVIATGGHVEPPPAQHAGAPLLAKPYTIDAIEPALAAACGG
ncbi:response regulator [Sphingosinicella ginsenosidimutans]|uniref:Response regulator n=1 Tax=Allosphingosinicella ginsenosidimutans TaxID=1176539 RepID=A0A5C6TVZ6_9SPHN|nr:response regulator [Sphingosinicella ginsenosidimutans]TXC64416.1 response regulator [Sphingosinicella ginsenosidimutans]